MIGFDSVSLVVEDVNLGFTEEGTCRVGLDNR
jgi:hypothetical protein